MEHADHLGVATADSCLISSGALRDIHRNARHSIYVGSGTNGWMWGGAQRSALVLGPPRSGKTSSLVIPNILLSEGPVVSTSTKPDVLRATANARRRDGWTLLYDPSGEVESPKGVERVGWSPLHGASDWDTAVVTADAMVRASRTGGPRASEHHWTERAGALLSVLLHAAARERLGMRDLLRWIDRHDGAPALEILSAAGADEVATDLLTGVVATDPREQSGIWSTASGVLAAYRTAGALASTEAPAIDFADFCDGANALYVCSTGRRQRQFAPLVVALLGAVRDAAYARAAMTEGGAPTLLALDEVANIAPVPDLPAMVSEGGGQGLLVLACLQDLSQARERWGASADGFMSLFGTTVVLRGIADMETLRAVSVLAGEHEVASTSITRSVGAWGRIRPTASVAAARVARLTPDAVAQGVPGRAVVLGPHKEVHSVALTPSHHHAPWRELTGGGRQLGGRGARDVGRGLSG
jgi:type IV secretory pathway TraG/TraD family ATPase VirD4